MGDKIMEKFTKPELFDFLFVIGDYDEVGDIPTNSIEETESLPEDN